MINKFFKYFLVAAIVVFVVPQIALAAWWNPFSWSIWNFFNTPTPTQTGTFYPNTSKNQIKNPSNCKPNWICSWGPCVNRSQIEVAVDSNNCGLSASAAKIACPALARLCGNPAPVPTPVPAKESACINSGGTVDTGTCNCPGVADFPNNCLIGGCSCAPNPQFEHQIKGCNCGTGKCFDGNSCVAQKY